MKLAGCLILTRNSIDEINHIHHRQPLLLEDYEINQNITLKVKYI